MRNKYAAYLKKSQLSIALIFTLLQRWALPGSAQGQTDDQAMGEDEGLQGYKVTGLQGEEDPAMTINDELDFWKDEEFLEKRIRGIYQKIYHGLENFPLAVRFKIKGNDLWISGYVQDERYLRIKYKDNIYQIDFLTGVTKPLNPKAKGLSDLKSSFEQADKEVLTLIVEGEKVLVNRHNPIESQTNAEKEILRIKKDEDVLDSKIELNFELNNQEFKSRFSSRFQLQREGEGLELAFEHLHFDSFTDSFHRDYDLSRLGLFPYIFRRIEKIVGIPFNVRIIQITEEFIREKIQEELKNLVEKSKAKNGEVPFEYDDKGSRIEIPLRGLRHYLGEEGFDAFKTRINKIIQGTPYPMVLKKLGYDKVQLDFDVYANIGRHIYEIIAKKDQAMGDVEERRTTSDERRKGGIDFNPNKLNLEIRRDENGKPLDLKFQPQELMEIDGLTPIIINITPITNLPLFLGLNTDPESSEENDIAKLSLAIDDRRSLIDDRK